jgi:hypothetical protein
VLYGFVPLETGIARDSLFLGLSRRCRESGFRSRKFGSFHKSRLVAQGFSQKEGIDYEETFAPVAHLEAIRILLAFSVAKGFKLHQMDVKSAFLNGVLEEEVYVRQPPGFESEKYPHRVYKLRKALYGLK